MAGSQASSGTTSKTTGSYELFAAHTALKDKPSKFIRTNGRVREAAMLQVGSQGEVLKSNRTEIEGGKKNQGNKTETTTQKANTC